MPDTLPQRRDWLLTAGRLFSWILMAIFALGFLITLAGLANGLAGFLGAYGDLPETAWAVQPDVFPWVCAGLVMAATLFAAAFRFVQLLERIVDSVSVDDPFTLLNAARLRQMAWLAIVFQLLSFLIAWPGPKLGEMLSMRALTSGDNLPLSGLMLAIVLFILAKVFRQGAEMRADLDGTV